MSFAPGLKEMQVNISKQRKKKGREKPLWINICVKNETTLFGA